MTLPDPDWFTREAQSAVRSAAAEVFSQAAPALHEALVALDVTRFERVSLFTARIQRPLALQVLGHERVGGEARSEWRGYLLTDRLVSAPLDVAWDALEKRVGALQSQWMAAYLESPDDPALLELASGPVVLEALEAELFGTLRDALVWPHDIEAELQVGDLRAMRAPLRPA